MDEQQWQMKGRYWVRAMGGVTISKHSIIEALAWATAMAVVLGLAWLANK